MNLMQMESFALLSDNFCRAPYMVRNGSVLFVAALFIQLFLLVSSSSLPVWAAKETSALSGTSGTGISGTGKGWHLYQESKLFGSHEIFASADGVKIVNKKLGTCVVVRLPSMQFAMYNQRMKLIHERKLATWKGGIAHRMKVIFPDQLDFKFVKAGTEQIAGAKTTIWECTNVGQNRLTKSGELRKPKLYKCFLAEQIKVPEAAANMVAQYYDFPRLGKIPLRVTHGNGPHKTRLDTVKVERMDVPASAYAIPQNLKFVKDEGQLLLEGSDHGLLDLLGGE